jgi:hypothetical protein
MKVCKTCEVESDNFGKNKHSKDGLNYVCNPCRAEYELQRRVAKGIVPKVKPIIVDGEHKECLKCKVILHLNSFRNNTRGPLGKHAYCISCNDKYHEDLRNKDIDKYRESHREYTQKYRDTHREYWRSLHRINQYNRRNLIDATKDGTATEDFMKSLYQIENCCWCGKFTPEKERTAEHIIPLIKGGIHGASNLTMACLSCNASKINFKKDDNS